MCTLNPLADTAVMLSHEVSREYRALTIVEASCPEGKLIRTQDGIVHGSSLQMQCNRGQWTKGVEACVGGEILLDSCIVAMMIDPVKKRHARNLNFFNSTLQTSVAK